MKQFFKRSWFFARQGRRQNQKNAVEDEILSLLDDTVIKFVLSFNNETRQYFLDLLNQGLNAEELMKRF